MAMGRYSALRMDDITCNFPKHQPVLTSLCEIVRITEAYCEDMYTQKIESLRLLYTIAQRAHAQLRKFAEKAGIGTDDVCSRFNGSNDVTALHLHNGCLPIIFIPITQSYTDSGIVYYHAVLVTFRPFLIAETLAYTQQKHGIMWLREACRHAVDAAQDSLVYINNQYSRLEACKVRSRCSLRSPVLYHCC